MPQVPYNPVPAVEPTTPGERIAVQTPPDAFGVNVGQALEHFGATVDQVGGELFQRAQAMQDLANENTARQTSVAYSTEVAKQQANFDALEGQAKVDALSGHLKSLEDIRQKYRTGLNPMAGKYFDSEASRVQNSFIIQSARQAGTAMRDWTSQEATADLDLQTKALVDPEDRKEVDGRIANIDRAIATLSHTHEWGPSKTADVRFNVLSKLYAEQANSFGRLGKIDQGFDTLEEAKQAGTISQQDYDTTLDHLRNRNEVLGSRLLIQKIYDPKKSIDQMFDEIDKAAPEYSHGDPLFVRAVKNEFRMKMAYDDRIAKEQLQRNINTISAGINNGEINSLADVQNNPNYGPAYAALPDSEKRKMPSLIAGAVKNRDARTEQAAYDTYFGMAHEFPNKFLDTNFLDPNLKLSTAHRKEFIAEQERLIGKNPINDPNVRRGINFMRTSEFGPAVAEMGVYYAPNRSASDDEIAKYSNYVGAMRTAIGEFKEEKKRPPTDEEFRKLIAPGLIASHQEPGVFGMLLGGRKAYNIQHVVTDDELKKARESIMSDAADKDIDVGEVSDNQVLDWLAHDYWKKFYQSKGMTSGRPEPTAPGSE